MQVTKSTQPIVGLSCDTLILYIFEAQALDSITEKIDISLSGQILHLTKESPDLAKNGHTTVLYTTNDVKAKQVVLLGLGKNEELTAEKLRSAIGNAIRVAMKLKAQTVALPQGVLTSTLTWDDSTQSIIEGALLGSYRFDYYKTDKKEALAPQTLILVSDKSTNPSDTASIDAGVTIATAVNLARDLVNHPANYMTPKRMAAQAKEIASSLKLEITILEWEDMEQHKMNALLAVGQGSHHKPKLITLKYIGAPNKPDLVAFVGKGITFDSGGISIKPGAGMHEMKDDMAGGATVLAAVQAIAELKLPVNVIGVVPCAENMPSGHAYRPGDVVTSMNGKTIEIISTDAEGRLILVDALTYALKLGATKVIDVATLTGACVVALGTVTSGVMSNNRKWCTQVLDAADQAAEKMWELPLFDEYKEQIKSPIADLKNSGGRYAGAITAGWFIAHFAENTPWVHIDIAGTVSSEKDSGYNVKGATGVGVRTLIQLAANLGKE
jgi:leucyl aminopeptidase